MGETLIRKEKLVYKYLNRRQNLKKIAEKLKHSHSDSLCGYVCKVRQEEMTVCAELMTASVRRKPLNMQSKPKTDICS